MKLFQVYDVLQEMVLAVDADWNVRYGNTICSTLFEVSAKRLATGKPIKQFIEFEGELLDAGQSLSSVGDATPLKEIKYKLANGKSGFVQYTVQKAPDEFVAGAPALWLIYFRDVSLEMTLHDKYRAELGQKESVIEDLKKARTQLEDYSKNLEKMVESRTTELREANQLIRAVLDSLAQGIAVFDRNGICLPVHSKICQEVLEKNPSGLSVPEVVGLRDVEAQTFNKWKNALFDGLMDFEDLAPLGPATYRHSGGKSISLNYYPMWGPERQLQNVVMVATDRTSEVAAQLEAERERKTARMIMQIVTNRDQYRTFQRETLSLMGKLSRVEVNGSFSYEEITRWLHTIKGGCMSFCIPDVAELVHHLEGWVTDFQKKNERWNDSTLQDFKTRVEAIQNRFQLFLQKNSELIGGEKKEEGRHIEVPMSAVQQWVTKFASSEIFLPTANEIYENYLMEPIEKSFKHYSQPMQDLASSLGKKLKPIQYVGGDLRVLPEPYNELFSNFVHAFRNSVDHGLEDIDTRVSLGKSEEGVLQVRFSSLDKGDRLWLRIEVVDDGRGIDPDKILARLEKLGRDESYRKKRPDEIIQAIFSSDFSTAENITEISGRGVGLSALKEQAEKLGGFAVVVSQPSAGAKIIVEVPRVDLNAQPGQKSFAKSA